MINEQRGRDEIACKTITLPIFRNLEIFKRTPIDVCKTRMFVTRGLTIHEMQNTHDHAQAQAHLTDNRTVNRTINRTYVDFCYRIVNGSAFRVRKSLTYCNIQ